MVGNKLSHWVGRMDRPCDMGSIRCHIFEASKAHAGIGYRPTNASPPSLAAECGARRFVASRQSSHKQP